MHSVFFLFFFLYIAYFESRTNILEKNIYSLRPHTYLVFNVTLYIHFVNYEGKNTLITGEKTDACQSLLNIFNPRSLSYVVHKESSTLFCLLIVKVGTFD